MNKLDEIKKGVDRLQDALLLSEPAHFSERDIVDAFFGSIVIGATFTLKGLVIEVAKAITRTHVIIIILTTLLLLTGEIYFIGYRRVAKKHQRRFGQFWLKRILAFYCIALLVSVFLVYIFGLNLLVNRDFWGIYKLIFIISLPCAMGASVGDLLKRY